MAWVKIPAIPGLFAEFDQAFPNRDHGSDGTIGDGEHSQSPSDHNPDETGIVEGESDSDSVNEVHAADVDADTGVIGGMERAVQAVLARCRSGTERRLRYIIFDRRIWSDDDGWRERYYSGGDPHTGHAHFSFHYGAGAGTGNPENITSPWGILAAIRGDDVELTDKLYGGAEPNESWTRRFPGSGDSMKNVWAFAAMYAKDGAGNSARLLLAMEELIVEHRKTNVLLEQLAAQGKAKG